MSKIIEVQGKAYDFDFDFHASDGFTPTANLIKKSGKVKTVYKNRMIMYTPYEALVQVACELWDAPEIGEGLCELLGYPIMTDEDAECDSCDYIGHYKEMHEDDGVYRCNDCQEMREKCLSN